MKYNFKLMLRTMNRTDKEYSWNLGAEIAEECLNAPLNISQVRKESMFRFINMLALSIATSTVFMAKFPTPYNPAHIMRADIEKFRDFSLERLKKVLTKKYDEEEAKRRIGEVKKLIDDKKLSIFEGHSLN